VIEAFAARFHIKVEASGQQRESIVFNLPRELRTSTAVGPEAQSGDRTERKKPIPAA
jgi:hypothetical protein